MRKRHIIFQCGYTNFGVGNGSTRWYSCLENFMDRGTWQITVHVSQSWAQLSTHTPISIPNNTIQGWHLLYTLTSLLLFLVLIIAKLYLIVFLICISRVISSIKNSLIYILAVCMSSLEKCRIRFFADFFLNYLVFCSDCMKRLCILDMNTLAESLQIFSHSTCYRFTVFFLFMCRTSLI